ncbi:MAG: tetratricopeptide repeat protein [Verrucomicrobia bacterium]|nr:tetratricopeptide repeat protein [Verrucomicrobiota bacterium]MBI3869085.1 tetratricopeptide repeat protein [Verrucomicrobiota bacterium]
MQISNEARTSPSPLRWLPWAAVALVAILYLLTLDSSFSPWSLPLIHHVNGWEWRPLSMPTMHWLGVFPASFLPVSAQPAAFSLLAIFYTTLSAILLVRTVILLPQERTRLQRQRPLQPGGILPATTAWLPATLAALVFGLQAPVWHNAIHYTGDLIDLLCFAYVVRALAEFRVDQRDRWLLKASFVFALGITQNFAMLAYLPLFLATSAWLKGWSFFQARFLIRFALLGTLGLLAYLIFPAIYASSDMATEGFWRALHDYLAIQKNQLLGYHRVTALLLCSVSIVPLLGLAFRWGEAGGDVSGASHAVTAWMTHLVAVAFLAYCLAAAFEYQLRFGADSIISVAAIASKAGSASVPTVHFLSAVAIGYYAGYLFLVFGTKPTQRWARPSGATLVMGQAVTALLAATLVVIPGLLIYTTFPETRDAQGDALNRLGRRLLQGIPDNSIVLSDTPVFHQLIEASSAVLGRRSQVIPVETAALDIPNYHKRQRHLMPDRWPALVRDYPATNRLPYGAVNLFLTRLSLSNQVFYSEPSMGYYFEAHYLIPTGMVYRLRPLPSSVSNPPGLLTSDIPATDALLREVAQSEFAPVLERSLRFRKKRINSTIENSAALAQTAYSRVLNTWGVALQKQGQFDKALDWFRQALVINTNNPAAEVNLSYNLFVRTNQSGVMPLGERSKELLKAYSGQSELMLQVNGPVDEPEALSVIAKRFAHGSLYLQSAQMMRRAAALTRAPDEYLMGVVKLLAEADRPNLALQAVDDIRKLASRGFLANPTNDMEILEIEGRATSRKGDFVKGEELLRQLVAKYPKQELPYSTLTGLYLQRADYALGQGRTNEFKEFLGKAHLVIGEELRQMPQSFAAWVNHGSALMQMEENANAIAAYTQALAIEKDSPLALLNRAICYYKSDQLALAQQDYERVKAITHDPPFQALYGLAEIAYRQNRKKEALEFYEAFLKKSPPNGREREEVVARVKELKLKR